uniref:HGWP repeat containing protein-like n=1 Tax=Oryza sativa subsp. japonica TaxID=39947 RepID=Q851A7_ORYSJ|nr:hypothetical protein [Oryza sativa Japonica Group]
MGIHIPTDRPASVATDWCLCLHGWPIMPPLLGVYDFTAGLPSLPPTGVLTYTVGWSHHRSWVSTSSPIGLPLPPPTSVFASTVGGHTTIDGHLFINTAGRLSCLHG